MPQHPMFSLSDSLLVEEIKGFALVTGQLLQGAAPLLDGRLNLRGGCVVLDVHRGLHRRLLGCPARRAEQTAETGGVRAGKWGRKKKRKAHRQTYRGGGHKQQLQRQRQGSTCKGKKVPFPRQTHHASFHTDSNQNDVHILVYLSRLHKPVPK